MQLKLKRTQRDGGIISTTAIFCLNARVEFTAEEQGSITRYKLQNQVIYNSEASRRLLDKGDAQRDGSALGSLKSLASTAFAAMKLNVSIASLQRGQHIECKSLDELLGAENAIMTACENLKGYLDAALTFDGTEVVIGFDTGKPQLVAQSSPPQQLISPAPTSIAHAPSALPAPDDIEEGQWEPASATESYEDTEWAEKPSFDIASFFDWENPVRRKRLFIGLGVLLFILLLRSCWH